jgi:hypothetical protein
VKDAFASQSQKPIYDLEEHIKYFLLSKRLIFSPLSEIRQVTTITILLKYVKVVV